MTRVDLVTGEIYQFNWNLVWVVLISLGMWAAIVEGVRTLVA